MKVLVAGATGRVASQVLVKLREQGYDVVAAARRVEKIADLPGLEKVSLDLHASVADLASVLAGVDAIIFTAGSRGTDLLQTDAYGAVKLMQAAKKAGIERFIMLSALYSLEPERWPNHLTDYYIAKYFADNYLVNQSGLAYTIIQPGTLMETEGTGKIQVGDQGFSQIPIPDVAASLVAVLDKTSTFNRVLAIHPDSQAIVDTFS